MHFFQINPVDRMRVHVVARSAQEAADLFVTWSAARDQLVPIFKMNLVGLETLEREQRLQIRRALAAGLVGIAHFDEEIGWTFSAPMWLPLGEDELWDKLGGA